MHTNMHAYGYIIKNMHKYATAYLTSVNMHIQIRMDESQICSCLLLHKTRKLILTCFFPEPDTPCVFSTPVKATPAKHKAERKFWY